MTYAQAAEVLGCHVSNVPKLVAKGYLESQPRRDGALNLFNVLRLCEFRLERPPPGALALGRRASPAHESCGHLPFIPGIADTSKGPLHDEVSWQFGGSMSGREIGWYRDPESPNHHRYWDGSEWSHAVVPGTHPTEPHPPAPPVDSPAT